MQIVLRTPAGPDKTYSMFRNNASGPEIGLPGRILAGLLPGEHRNQFSDWPKAGRRADFVDFPAAFRIPNSHEIVLELVCGTEFWCNRHCRTSPVVLEGFWGQVWPKIGRKPEKTEYRVANEPLSLRPGSTIA